MNYYYLGNLVDEMIELVDKGEEPWNAWEIVCVKNKLNQREARCLYQQYEVVMSMGRREEIYAVR